MTQHLQNTDTSPKGEAGRGLTYNPDVLNCIANLSNDEVFTPPELANKMLDLLPQELFSSPKTTFLDPFTKSGVFLREIVKRLDRGLADEIPDRQKRIDHILHHQVFGIACTELTSLLARRSVYCSKYANGQYSISKFNTPEGNILYRNMSHTWVNGKCKYCGASQAVYDRGSEAEQYAYMFIHTDNPKQFFNNMKFDVIVGNPPYQMNDGGNSASAKPLYHLFVEQSKLLNPKYFVLIIPARWYAGGKGLEEFRNSMLKDDRIQYIVDYPNSSDCFNGVNIAGGVCYLLWCKDKRGMCKVINVHGESQSSSEKRRLDEFSVFVRDNTAIHIVRKVGILKEKTMDNTVLSRNAFNIPSNERGHSSKQINDKILLSSDGYSYINAKSISDRDGITNKYKVIITYAMSGGNKPGSDGKYQILSSLLVLPPNSVCTETYLIIDSFSNQVSADNCCSYLKTNFVRFLLLQALSSIHITKSVFLFVPLQDFSHPWTDEMLYKKYSLTPEEIAFIESMIRPME